MIELKEDEVKAILNDLSRMPYGQVVGLMMFFNNKLNEKLATEKVEPKEESK